MTKKKTYAVFFTLLVVGIGLCIGGIWAGEALLIIGAAFIAGALGMCSQSQVFTTVDEPSSPQPIPQNDIEAQAHETAIHNIRPHHTILFSRQISSHDSAGHHYRQTVNVKEEIEDSQKSDETSYHTANGSPRDNRLTNS